MSADRGFRSCAICGKQKLIDDGRNMCDACLCSVLTEEMVRVDSALRLAGWRGPSPCPLPPGVDADDERRERFILRTMQGGFRLDLVPPSVPEPRSKVYYIVNAKRRHVMEIECDENSLSVVQAMIAWVGGLTMVESFTIPDGEGWTGTSTEHGRDHDGFEYIFKRMSPLMNIQADYDPSGPAVLFPASDSETE